MLLASDGITIGVKWKTVLPSKIYGDFFTVQLIAAIAKHCKRDWWNSGAKQDFSGFMQGKFLLYFETNPIFPTFPA